jgi:hypothetical protein
LAIVGGRFRLETLFTSFFEDLSSSALLLALLSMLIGVGIGYAIGRRQR